MKLGLAILFAPAALYFVVSNTHVTLHAGAPSGPSATVREVQRVTAAAHRGRLDAALRQAYVTFNGKRGWTKGRAVPLARRVGELSEDASTGVAAVEVQTETGRRFRAVLAEGLRRQGLLYRGLAHDLATNKPAVRALQRWAKRLRAVRRRYELQVQWVVDGAPAEERAAVDAAAY